MFFKRTQSNPIWISSIFKCSYRYLFKKNIFFKSESFRCLVKDLHSNFVIFFKFISFHFTLLHRISFLTSSHVLSTGWKIWNDRILKSFTCQRGEIQFHSLCIILSQMNENEQVCMAKCSFYTYLCRFRRTAFNTLNI